MADWADIPLASKLFTNIEEEGLTKAFADLENSYINEAGGHVRFPGLKPFCTLTGHGRVSLGEWKNDLIAVTADGQVFRVTPNGEAENVTGVPVTGARRAIFTKTDEELVIAAGGTAVRFAGEKTEILSDDCPKTTHVQYVDGYLIANEFLSNRFRYSEASNYRVWPAINIYSATHAPDNIDSLLVNGFGEVMAFGDQSVEQFERLANGTVPFFRRWRSPEGIHRGTEYAVIEEDNAFFMVNNRGEFVRLSGQTSNPYSDDLGATFENIDDWRDAWAGRVSLDGQKFVVLQFPYASNPYGTKGLTFGLDVRSKKWTTLYGWDAQRAAPARWPGWSIFETSSSFGKGRKLVGGDGCIYEFTKDTYYHDGGPAVMRGKSAHYRDKAATRIDAVRMTLKRGVGGYDKSPKLAIRAIKDNDMRTQWEEVDLGLSGANDLTVEFGTMGTADTWQFEWRITDDCRVNIMKVQAYMEPVG